MRRLTLVTITLLFTALAGCAQKLANYDYDPGFRFADYRSFALQQSAKQSYQSLDSGRIEDAVKQQLTPRYQFVDREKADFLVSYYLEADRKIDQSGFSFGFGVASSNVGVGLSTGPKAKEVMEGKLILEIVDIQSSQVVWSAKSSKNLRENMKPAARQALIQQLVQEMLGNFPP
jgi:hypothetical protein